MQGRSRLGEHRALDRWVDMLLGVTFSLIGPTIEFAVHRRIPLDDGVSSEVSIFWGNLVMYTWPTVLLGFAGIGWLVIAGILNTGMFIGIAVALHIARTKKQIAAIIFAVAVLWPLLIGYFLAGFKLDRVTGDAYAIGVGYYSTFCALVILISRLTQSGTRDASPSPK